MKKRMALAALCAKCSEAVPTSTSDSARRCAAQITLPTSCVSSTPTTITADSRPSSDCGSSRSFHQGRDAPLSDIADGDIGREHIAGAAHRFNQQRLLAAVVQAQPQPADLHVEEAVHRAGIAAAGFLAQHVAVEDVAGVLDEIFQQLEVEAGQRHDLAL